MADKHLKRYPHHPHKGQPAWWYEEPDGIAVVVTRNAIDERFNMAEIKIPWVLIRRALARKDRK